MPSSKSASKTVLLTGGTGLIGNETLAPLLEQGFTVYALTARCVDATFEAAFPSQAGVHWVQANLQDAAGIEAIMARVQPSHLLHLAWATTGDYLSSNTNFDLLAASLHLLQAFHRYGGRRVVFAGTCFEYALLERPLNEATTPLKPTTVYAECKVHLSQLAALFCEKNQLSFGWGRIFYVYGQNEHPSRLTAALIASLQADRPFTLKSGPLKKDYMYAKEIAAAFACFLDSPVEGCVNIGTGQAITIEAYARCIAKTLGKEHLLVFEDDCQGAAPLVQADVTRLSEEVGFRPRYSLKAALAEMLTPCPTCV